MSVLLSLIVLSLRYRLFTTFVRLLSLCLHVFPMLNLVILYFWSTSETDVRFAIAYLLVLSFRYRLFTTFVRLLLLCLHVFPMCLLNLVILQFCSTSETDVRFAIAYLLLVLSVRYHLFTTFARSLSVCLLVFPMCLLNWVILYFYTTSERDVRFANAYLLLVLSVRYHLFTTFVRSLSVSLHVFPMCLLNLVILYCCTTSETDVPFASALLTYCMRLCLHFFHVCLPNLHILYLSVMDKIVPITTVCTAKLSKPTTSVFYFLLGLFVRQR